MFDGEFTVAGSDIKEKNVYFLQKIYLLIGEESETIFCNYFSIFFHKNKIETKLKRENGCAITFADTLRVSMAGSVGGLPEAFFVESINSVKAAATSFADISNMTLKWRMI